MKQYFYTLDEWAQVVDMAEHESSAPICERGRLWGDFLGEVSEMDSLLSAMRKKYGAYIQTPLCAFHMRNETFNRWSRTIAKLKACDWDIEKARNMGNDTVLESGSCSNGATVESNQSRVTLTMTEKIEFGW